MKLMMIRIEGGGGEAKMGGWRKRKREMSGKYNGDDEDDVESKMMRVE